MVIEDWTVGCRKQDGSWWIFQRFIEVRKTWLCGFIWIGKKKKKETGNNDRWGVNYWMHNWGERYHLYFCDAS